ncbi:MAG: hypothetical protein IJM59_00735 [Proteobacteria bacterium]|nr:hypothetical protein [Pseudomonadota bacterium]
MKCLNYSVGGRGFIPYIKNFEWLAIFAFTLTSACSLESVDCGNGVLDDDEICDAEKMSYEAACPNGMLLPEGASLSCNAKCTLNTDACVPAQSTDTPCGNGVLDPDEVCDAEKMKFGAACPTGMHLPENTRLSCNADCTLNTNACVPDEPAVSQESCGNGILDDGEICDGEKFSKDAKCQKGSHLPEGARLICNADCSLNTDACVKDDEPIVEPPKTCGNDRLDEGEECDGSIISQTASCPKGMHLPDGKSFACHENCTLDTSACEITISTTIPQGRVVPNKEYAADLTEIPLHRTPQHVFPNKDLYADREDEPSQIVINVPKDTVLDIIGSVGSKWLVKYNGEEGYIHSMHVQRVNDLEIPRLDYSSPSTSNYYQKDDNNSVSAAIADALSFKGSSITPDVIANKVGTYLGKSADYICQLVKKEYQLKCEYLDNKKGMNGGGNTTNDAATRSKAKAKMQEAFKKGWYVVAEEGCGESSYWGNKRTILVYGYDEKNDRIYVDDPQNRHYMQEKGMESFLDCNHTMSIITDTCVPKTCKDLSSACGNNIDDGCGGKLNCPCTATGTVIKPPKTDSVICRRSPQNRNLINDWGDLVNNEHYGTGGKEERQIVKLTYPGDTFELLAKIENPHNKLKDNQIWYQVKVKIDNRDEYCFLPANFLDVKTNGMDIPDFKWSSGSTNNYMQQDSQWSGIEFFHDPEMKFVGGDGCGMSSLANAISALTGNNDVNPGVTAQKYTNYRNSVTNAYDRFCAVATEYGLACNAVNVECGNAGTQNNPHYPQCNGKLNQVHKDEKKLLKETFQKGGFVLALQFGIYWTEHGHWITVYGYDEARDIIYADDSMNRKYMQQGVENFLNTCNYMIAITPK